VLPRGRKPQPNTDLWPDGKGKRSVRGGKTNSTVRACSINRSGERRREGGPGEEANPVSLTTLLRVIKAKKCMRFKEGQAFGEKFGGGVEIQKPSEFVVLWGVSKKAPKPNGGRGKGIRGKR